ncbi:hypothetical protein MMC30_003633 [Trapelia coarctata]|nr:hypothetical protein [Trapelia coarctata]
MAPHYDLNTLLAISLVHTHNMDISEILPILDKNTTFLVYPASFDTALYEEILSYLQNNFSDWLQWVQGRKADELRRGIYRLRAGLLGRLERSTAEPTFDALKSMWTGFVREGSFKCAMNDDGQLWLLETVPRGEGELVTLPEIEFFDEQGNCIPV